MASQSVTPVYSGEVQSEYSFSDYLAICKRRFWPGVSVASGILVIAFLLALLLPAVYESTATILIEQQEIPEDLVRSLSTTYADQRIQMISQRVMTSSNLSSIVNKYNLYEDERQRMPLEVVLDNMQGDIVLETVSADVVDPRSGRSAKATIAFTLTYENQNPRLAQQVANELVTLYLNENLKQRTETAQETSTFLAAEAEKLRGQVASLEDKIADFKEQHVNTLPELTQLNLELMNRAEQQIMEIDRQISSYEQQRVYLESELAQISPLTDVYTETGKPILGPEDQLKVLKTELVSAVGRYGPEHPDVVNLKRQVRSLEAYVGGQSTAAELQVKLDGLQGERAAALDRYSSEHPDVKRIEREMAAVEQELLKAKESPPAAAAMPTSQRPNNPSYIQLKARLDAANGELRTLKEKRAEFEAKIADYEQRIVRTPQVEREYKSLARDYENAIQKFQEVTAKKLEAEVAGSLESEQKGERFTLIEPPLLPVEPSSPNRIAIALLGLILSFTGGLGSIAAAEALDQTVRGRRGVINVTGVAPLGIIPVINAQPSGVERYRRQALLAGGVLLGAILLLMIVHYFVMPLDVAWFATLRKIGL